MRTAALSPRPHTSASPGCTTTGSALGCLDRGWFERATCRGFQHSCYYDFTASSLHSRRKGQLERPRKAEVGRLVERKDSPSAAAPRSSAPGESRERAHATALAPKSGSQDEGKVDRHLVALGGLFRSHTFDIPCRRDRRRRPAPPAADLDATPSPSLVTRLRPVSRRSCSSSSKIATRSCCFRRRRKSLCYQLPATLSRHRDRLPAAGAMQDQVAALVKGPRRQTRTAAAKTYPPRRRGPGTPKPCTPISS